MMSGMGGMSRTGRGRGRARAEIAVVRVLEKRLGALPVVAEFGRRLRIAEIVDELCPVRPVAWISHGEVIEALVANRLTAPAPMVRVQEWAAAMAVDEAYGISPGLLNDDFRSPGRWTRLPRSWMRSPAVRGRRRSRDSVLMCRGCTGI